MVELVETINPHPVVELPVVELVETTKASATTAVSPAVCANSPATTDVSADASDVSMK
ncbi:hypothetical protein OH802_04475 [Nocardioides sp. NBC_00850]|uniref:hypothetical protein n=1 Tax=Nocardioides sp. NBC_00850 TaxID=2976001 RepID=UPI0038653490|nr:hypothetical protein OH802_04475 [Nocardioides sp. NBC_00850]